MQNQIKFRKAKLGKLEFTAFYSSIIIIVVGAIYWIIQINGVLEMLEMAYG